MQRRLYAAIWPVSRLINSPPLYIKLTTTKLRTYSEFIRYGKRYSIFEAVQPPPHRISADSADRN